MGIAVVPSQQPPSFSFSSTATKLVSISLSSASGPSGSSPAAAGSTELAEEDGGEEGSDRMPRRALGDPPDPEGVSLLANDKGLAETRKRFVDERFDMTRPKEPEIPNPAELPGDPGSVFGPLSPSEWELLGSEGLVVANRGSAAGSSAGEGAEPVPGDYIKLHLVGRLEDGTVVDDDHSPEKGVALHVLWMTR